MFIFSQEVFAESHPLWHQVQDFLFPLQSLLPILFPSVSLGAIGGIRLRFQHRRSVRSNTIYDIIQRKGAKLCDVYLRIGGKRICWMNVAEWAAAALSQWISHVHVIYFSLQHPQKRVIMCESLLSCACKNPNVQGYCPSRAWHKSLVDMNTG